MKKLSPWEILHLHKVKVIVRGENQYHFLMQSLIPFYYYILFPKSKTVIWNIAF